MYEHARRGEGLWWVLLLLLAQVEAHLVGLGCGTRDGELGGHWDCHWDLFVCVGEKGGGCFLLFILFFVICLFIFLTSSVLRWGFVFILLVYVWESDLLSLFIYL